MRLNNLDLDVLGGVMERGRTDTSVFRLHKRVEGRWSFTAGEPAYTASVSHGKDTTDLHVDIAPGFGGQGLAPDPLQYLLAGLGACYASTMVTIAATEGVELNAVSVVAEQDVNVAAVYDSGDAPLMEQITVAVHVSADIDDATLARWQDAARANCPFVYTILHPIPLTTTVERA
ncbi:OsmC family protein [Tessaracoccus sp. G1721]